MVHTLGFTPEYVDGLSPAELGVYRAQYIMEINRKKMSERRKALADVGLTIEDMM